MIDRTRRQFREIRIDLFRESFRVTARQANREIRSGVVGSVKIAHVLECQLFQSANRATILMTVRMVARINHRVENFFAELFIVAATQRSLQIIDRIFLEPGEIVFAKSGIEQHLANQRIVLVEIVDVRCA